jgi:hypothetical protein
MQSDESWDITELVEAEALLDLDEGFGDMPAAVQCQNSSSLSITKCVDKRRRLLTGID